MSLRHRPDRVLKLSSAVRGSLHSFDRTDRQLQVAPSTHGKVSGKNLFSIGNLAFRAGESLKTGLGVGGTSVNDTSGERLRKR